MSARKTSNLGLPPLPDDAVVIEAVAQVVAERPRGATANRVAQHLRVQGATRGGRGAVAGSWSGVMSPALRMAPRLQALAKRGLLVRSYDDENYRYLYHPKRRA